MLKKLSTATLSLALLAMTPNIVSARAPANAPMPEDSRQCPHIHAALRELGFARHELDKAGHDFGGHKREAIEAVDNAIHKLVLAQESCSGPKN
jgi:hypothetical protein